MIQINDTDTWIYEGLYDNAGGVHWRRETVKASSRVEAENKIKMTFQKLEKGIPHEGTYKSKSHQPHEYEYEIFVGRPPEKELVSGKLKAITGWEAKRSLKRKFNLPPKERCDGLKFLRRVKHDPNK